MLVGYKQLKGKEMVASHHNKMAQIQRFEGDTGGEEKKKRSCGWSLWIDNKMGVPWVTGANYKPRASIFGLS